MGISGRLSITAGYHSFLRSNRLQHRRASVTLLIALWNPNSPSAELLSIRLHSTAKKPSTSSQETCECFTKKPGLNAIGSGNGWLFQWDKPNQRQREQMAFLFLKHHKVLLAWLSLPRHLYLIVGSLSLWTATDTMTHCSGWWVVVFFSSGLWSKRLSHDQEPKKQLCRLNEAHLCLPPLLLCNLMSI